jgi:2,4-dienoyl-CoA reductase-like NADH-dependent reductase (Old Yellow Enzyme family)
MSTSTASSCTRPTATRCTNPHSNQHADGYGGLPEARARFVVEVAGAVVAAVGADRVGIGISPAHNIQA